MKKKLLLSILLTLSLALVLAFATACGSSNSEQAEPAEEPTSSDLSIAEDINKMLEVTGEANKNAEEVAYTLAYDEDLGDSPELFRNAGSDAEHRAADYLVKEFEKIGLQDVKKEGVTVDKWQFNDAYVNIKYTNKDGEAKELKIDDIVSYAAQGTVQLGGDYSNLEIVNMGMGTIDDYNAYYEKTGATDMSGKIVLVGVDQWNEVWIDGPYMEASTQNAAALISYALDGYAAFDNDTINIQDICCFDLEMPCTSISKNNADKILKILKKGSDVSAELFVDNELGHQTGTSYNVTGVIKGTQNTGQRILVAGHYDKYFYGFEDDSTAVGLVTGIAKAIIDSGYQPANDIVFIAHGSEEWGRLDTSTDWAIGSWEMITTAHPEWQGTTLAEINFEMPSVDSHNPNGVMRTTYEVGEIGNGLLNSGLLGSLDSYYEEGIVVKNDDNELPRTDAVCYQFNGVPAFMPRQEDREQWTKNRYHTQRDTNETDNDKEDGVHSTELLEYQLSVYAALAMYIDSRPALELDFNSRCDDFQQAIKGTGKYATKESVQAYKAELKKLREVAAANLKEAKAINDKYEAAVKDGDEEAMKAAREEGIKHNEKSLEAFKFVQDNFMGLADYGTIELFHKGLQNNLDLYTSVVDALSDGDITEDDIWIAAEINGWYEYYAYLFSDEVCAMSNDLLMNKYVDSNWGTNKMTLAIPDSWKTTKKMYALWNDGVKDADEYQSVVEEYKGYIDILKTDLQKYVDSETEAMKTLKTML